MLNKPQIILASASPRRAELLCTLGLEFKVEAPHGVEELLTGKAAELLALQNALHKAAAVADHHQDATVIGADTIVVRNGEVFGKPDTLDYAVSMLLRLAGAQHVVITGVCIIHRAMDTELLFSDSTQVWMHPLSTGQIRDYFRKMNPLDKAGAYAIQEHGEGIVERIEGSYSNVVGLPMEKLTATFQKMGMLPGDY